MTFSLAVLLPLYAKDSPDWVHQSISSIINQTYRDFVLFVGVDGPIDNDLEIILQSFEKDQRVRIIRFETNRGLAKVLNDLLTICFEQGFDYVARMDADDRSLPDRLEKQMEYLSNHPDVDVVGGSISEIDEDGFSRNKVIVYPETPDGCRAFFARRNPHAHPAVLFRRSFFDKIGHLYRPEYRQNQDTMLWYDGFMAGTRNANIPDVVLEFRITNSLFKKRRNGWAFAKKQLTDRKLINKDLSYGLFADIYGYAMFVMLISPPWVKKIAYKVFR